MRLDGRDLVDLALDLRQQLSVRRHYFPNYSFEVHGYRHAVSARRRVALSRRRPRPSIAAVASLAAAVRVAVGRAASPRHRRRNDAATASKPRPGRPPLSLALGFRTDAEARDLAQGQALYAHGRRRLPLALRQARLAGGEGRARLRPVARRVARPRSSSSRSSIPGSRSCSSISVLRACGRTRAIPSRPGVRRSRRSRTRRTRSSRATSCTPISRAASRRSSRPSARPRPSRACRPRGSSRRSGHHAERGGLREQLLYGVGLQRVGRPVSAARVFDRAARSLPERRRGTGRSRCRPVRQGRARARVRAPRPAHPRLPRGRSTVRFHLGVLLLWTGRIDWPSTSSGSPRHAQPGSPLAREAERYLETIRRARSSTACGAEVQPGREARCFDDRRCCNYRVTADEEGGRSGR